MRTFLILLLSCLSGLASDTGVHMTSSLTTNETGAVFLEETFTRDGQTNLIRKTKTEGGVIVGRVQRFYHDGEFIAVYLLVTKSAKIARESFSTAESSYSVSLGFSPTKEIESLFITKKKGNVFDAFTATNGIFYPVNGSELQVRPMK